MFPGASTKIIVTFLVLTTMTVLVSGGVGGGGLVEGAENVSESGEYLLVLEPYDIVCFSVIDL